MFTKWFEIIFDHRIGLRERMFRVVTGICMVALVIILPMGKSLVNLLLLAAGLVSMAMIVRITIQKECIHTGATIITILLLIPFRQADFIVECRNGLCFASFISVLLWREGER